MQSVLSHHSELHSVAPPCDWGGPQFSYYREATCLTPIISELARSALMCIAHCSSRTVLGRKLTTRFQIVLQQMLTDAEVSSQEGCIQKVGKLVLCLLSSCRGALWLSLRSRVQAQGHLWSVEHGIPQGSRRMLVFMVQQVASSSLHGTNLVLENQGETHTCGNALGQSVA